jgi:hypothetical protein
MDRAGNAFSVAAAASASVNNVTITRSSLASGYATITRIFNTGTALRLLSPHLPVKCYLTVYALALVSHCLPLRAVCLLQCTTRTALHYTHCTTLHSTALHYTHCTTLHSTTLHTLHYTAQHYTHCTTLHSTALRYTHCTTLHSTALHYTTLYCTALHYTTLPYTDCTTTLPYTALHYLHVCPILHIRQTSVMWVRKGELSCVCNPHRPICALINLLIPYSAHKS